MLRVESRSGHGTLEIETQPFLNSAHPAALGKVEEHHEIEDDGCGEDAISAEKVNLNLHWVAKPTIDINVVPTFLVVATGRVIMDPDFVRKLLIKVGIEVWLENLIE